ncbi:MAG TPA: lipopolysaccharide heptosyltransferase II [Verrucomicrobiae bacterium]
MTDPLPSSPSPRRILVRSVNWLGDAVMSTPALRRLRERFPDASITLLTPAKLAGLWEHHPAIDEIISFTAEENIFAVAKKLRPANFDLALVLPNSPRSALETWLAGIPQRIGYARPWRNFFLTRTVASRPEAVKMHKRSTAEIHQLIAQPAGRGNPKPKIPQAAHQIFEYLHLTAALGANSEPLAPQLFVTPEEMAAAKTKFGLDKISGPIFGLNPGAEYGPAKRWPVEKFIAAATEIHQHTDCVWILFGGKGDAELGAQIEAGTRNLKFKILNLTGQTSLRELMALLKLCRVLLTNDTGPAHAAVALNTPLVIPFGSTSPELTAPGLPGDPRNHLLQSDAPCSPCFLRECPIDFRCMNDITVERVVKAVLAAANQ